MPPSDLGVCCRDCVARNFVMNYIPIPDSLRSMARTTLLDLSLFKPFNDPRILLLRFSLHLVLGWHLDHVCMICMRRLPLYFYSIVFP